VHAFCRKGGKHNEDACADGEAPRGALLADNQGDLYGTTTYTGGEKPGGTLFELSGSSFKVLHTFCANNCLDGEEPWQNLVPTPGGAGVIGDTYRGPTENVVAGAIFEYTR
jgi:uncharacterized repeat protein (TIGR03803 family)